FRSLVKSAMQGGCCGCCPGAGGNCAKADPAASGSRPTASTRPRRSVMTIDPLDPSRPPLYRRLGRMRPMLPRYNNPLNASGRRQSGRVRLSPRRPQGAKPPLISVFLTTPDPMSHYDFRTPRLHVDERLAAGAEVALDRDRANYLFNVLRLAAGDPVLLFNGRDGEWRAEVTSVGKRGGTLTVGDQARAQPAPGRIDLMFAPLKHARLD